MRMGKDPDTEFKFNKNSLGVELRTVPSNLGDAMPKSRWAPAPMLYFRAFRRRDRSVLLNSFY